MGQFYKCVPWDNLANVGVMGQFGICAFGHLVNVCHGPVCQLYAMEQFGKCDIEQFGKGIIKQ